MQSTIFYAAFREKLALGKVNFWVDRGKENVVIQLCDILNFILTSKIKVKSYIITNTFITKSIGYK